MESKNEYSGYDLCVFLDYGKSNDIFLNEIGSYNCPPSYSYGPCVRAQAIFHYVKSGYGTLVLGDKEYKIGPHQGFYIPEGLMAYYIADSEEPWSYIWWHLGGPRMSEILYKIGLNKDNPVISPTTEVDTPIKIFDDIAAHVDQEYYCIGKTYELYDYLIRTTNIFKSNNHEVEQLNYVKKTINYIQVKYEENIKVEQIAEACGLNRSYLSRLFKEATGVTIQDYLIDYRLKKAVQLLQNSQYSIQYIAIAVGYSDIYTFSKAFKKRYKKSPSEYRLT